VGTLRDALEAVAGALTAGGIRVALDARELNPPGALLVPIEHRHTLGLAGGVTEVRVYLVGPNIGTLDALDVLDELAGTVRALGFSVDQMLVESLTVAGVAQGDPLPALTFTTSVHHD
jgi:hypothetical protein